MVESIAEAWHTVVVCWYSQDLTINTPLGQIAIVRKGLSITSFRSRKVKLVLTRADRYEIWNSKSPSRSKQPHLGGQRCRSICLDEIR